MKYIGAHVSTSGGVENAPENASNIDAKAFALFTKNQRRWEARSLTQTSIDKFKEQLKRLDFNPLHILPHDSYLINLGHPDPQKREKSYVAFVDELLRCALLGLKYLNIHPGSHLREISEQECMENIAMCINKAIKEVSSVSVVLENTAGQGSNLGYRFEQLATIIDLIEDKSRIGVCLDTCHTFVSGYDIRTPDTYQKTMDEFEKIVGFKYLKGMHINDSKAEFASKKDRHHSIGKGFIGLETFKLVMNDPRLDDIPMILETIDSKIWKEEIALLYGLIK
ncbi:MAG: deoxyribonuclease IV [Bacteriovoracaceae bacterium]|nr:deoxyribonuclease IV [Bacteriovoracaceae bacterium]